MSAALEILRWIALVYCGLSLFGVLLTVTLGLVAPIFHARRARRTDLPPISFVLPIKDWAPGFRPSQSSVFELDYPKFDVTATAAEAESRAVSAMRSIIEAYPDHDGKIVRSTASFAASPKVNNIFQAIEDAEYDLIATKDSNIELPPQTARAAIAAMTEGVGLVTAITEAKGAKNPAAMIEASLMNQSHARILHAAAAIGLGFGLGKLMIFKRSDLHRAGGFDAIAHTVGEDSATAHALAAIGLRTVIIGAPIYQMLGVRRFSDVYNRQMRWAVIRRQNELPGFLLEPLGLSVFVALAAAFAAPLLGWSSLAALSGVLLFWFVCETALAFARGWDVSVSAPAVMIARDAMMASVWLRAWFTKRVVWAAEVYDSRQDRGEPPAPAAPAQKRNDA
ncbi:MAG: glycosyltransferase [Rhodoblastus sp.]|nr:glycosyltransferase [Rhodoblastus sp.]MCB9998030.1 glycosyltransferase [Methylobacteriaceae bacterium]MCC0002090.1 glycosyltransferase [Methylobacteriaceae bacterium]MCC2100363.1 glycosyltransferase [Hyphomicrobiales bacterium]MCO5087949.1 glycosyltransferase [Methylobacteriaceae bacterium]